VADDVKRSYRAPGRAAAARTTRRRVRDAAAPLFIRHGYIGTSLRQVAHEARVGERTVYDIFGSKVALFSEVLGAAVAGDDEPVPVLGRPELQSALAERDGAQVVSQLAGYTADLFERAGDLIMVSVAAAGADDDMRAAADAGAARTREALQQFASHLAELGCLADGITQDEAADRLFAVASPHVHHLLRRMCQWTPDAYRAWMEATMRSQVLAT
jgi:AcrR family transcriptional regulator